MFLDKAKAERHLELLVEWTKENGLFEVAYVKDLLTPTNPLDPLAEAMGEGIFYEIESIRLIS